MVLCIAHATSVHAQVAEPPVAAAPPPPAVLSLVARTQVAALDAEALRTQLAEELALPIVGAAVESPPCIVVEAATLAAVRVAFVRSDGSRVERTLDVASTADHALETVALVAGNLVRDEAGELLASLRAQSPAPATPATPPPAPAPAPPPPAALPPPAAADEPKVVLPGGCDPNGLRQVRVGADALPYLGTSWVQGVDVERRLSFNLLGGLTGSVRGFELAGLFNVETHGLCGVQIAGIANLVEGPVDGAQLGFVNWAHGQLQGTQVGLVSASGGPADGAQLGLVTISRGLQGAQLGLANVNAGERLGIQIGLANITTGPARGVQLGLANVGARVRGAQIGLANFDSGRVDGAMVGMLNVAEDAEVPIAPLTILWRGRTHLDLWGTDAGFAMVGIEHGGKRVHNLYGVGATPRDGRAVFTFAYGIGFRPLDVERWFVDLDAVGYGLLSRNKELDRMEIGTIGQLRLPIGLRLAPGVALFLGPAINVSVFRAEDELRNPGLYGTTRLTSQSSDVVVRMWPGFSGGMRFF